MRSVSLAKASRLREEALSGAIDLRTADPLTTDQSSNQRSSESNVSTARRSDHREGTRPRRTATSMRAHVTESLGGAAFVAMMQATDFGEDDDGARVGRGDGSRVRRVLAEGEMRP